MIDNFLSITMITDNIIEQRRERKRSLFLVGQSFLYVVITHEETQFDKTASEEDSSSTSLQEMTLTIELAASPTLMSKYIIVRIFADFIIVYDILYTKQRNLFLGSSLPRYFAQRNWNQVNGCIIKNAVTKIPIVAHVFQLKPLSLK